jgi:hypothetical protein
MQARELVAPMERLVLADKRARRLAPAALAPAER